MRNRDMDRNLCDLHGHFLPGMDDGCKSAEEALMLLRPALRKGLACMAATPHYYPEESIGEFLVRREQSLCRLKEAAGADALPRILLGAEVAYHPGLILDEDIRKLCLGQSNFLLLEMPFSRWTPGVLRNVRTLYHVHGLVPVIAHLERYLELQDRRAVDELLDGGVLVQMNASYILDRRSRRKALRMIRRGMVDVLGSDCHNLSHRPANLAEAWDVLVRAGLDEELDEILETMWDICEQAEL